MVPAARASKHVARADGRETLCPERAHYHSLGQRPGANRPQAVQALKGRHKLRSPFQGCPCPASPKPRRCPGLMKRAPSGRMPTLGSQALAGSSPPPGLFHGRLDCHGPNSGGEEGREARKAPRASNITPSLPGRGWGEGRIPALFPLTLPSPPRGRGGLIGAFIWNGSCRRWRRWVRFLFLLLFGAGCMLFLGSGLDPLASVGRVAPPWWVAPMLQPGARLLLVAVLCDAQQKTLKTP